MNRQAEGMNDETAIELYAMAAEMLEVSKQNDVGWIVNGKERKNVQTNKWVSSGEPNKTESETDRQVDRKNGQTNC